MIPTEPQMPRAEELRREKIVKHIFKGLHSPVTVYSYNKDRGRSEIELPLTTFKENIGEKKFSYLSCKPGDKITFFVVEVNKAMLKENGERSFLKTSNDYHKPINKFCWNTGIYPSVVTYRTAVPFHGDYFFMIKPLENTPENIALVKGVITDIAILMEGDIGVSLDSFVISPFCYYTETYYPNAEVITEETDRACAYDIHEIRRRLDDYLTKLNSKKRKRKKDSK